MKIKIALHGHLRNLTSKVHHRQCIEFDGLEVTFRRASQEPLSVFIDSNFVMNVNVSICLLFLLVSFYFRGAEPSSVPRDNISFTECTSGMLFSQSPLPFLSII